jgi:hypothetical protein
VKAWSFAIASFRILDDEVVVVVKITSEGIEKSAFGGSSITKDAHGREVSLAADLNVAAERALAQAVLQFEGVRYSPREEPRARHHPTTERPLMPEEVAPSPAERITSRQLSAIYGASRRHDLGRDGLARLIKERTGKPAAQFLTKAEASGLLDALNGPNGASSIQ